jgi:prepilin-type N-terminal cleavage/methylation domain-containing protein
MSEQLGYSLVEVILVIVILGIISTFVGMFMFYDVNMYNHVKANTKEVQDARMAIQRLTGELRQIASTDSITTASQTTLQFYDLQGTQIQYQYSGDKLYRNSAPMLTTVLSCQFSYYDDAETPLALPVADVGLIRYIRVDIDKNLNGKTVTLTTRVFPRNFR